MKAKNNASYCALVHQKDDSLHFLTFLLSSCIHKDRVEKELKWE